MKEEFGYMLIHPRKKRLFSKICYSDCYEGVWKHKDCPIGTFDKRSGYKVAKVKISFIKYV